MDTRKSILEDFLGTECVACGAEKKSKMSHCSKCFWKLPKAMRDKLYKRFGEGYEEAFDESTKWLANKYPRRPVTGRLF
jgi:hypothetical protein